MKWEQKYIDEAVKVVTDQYEKNYAPLPEPEQREETDEDDELINHIYKRQKVEKGSELKVYLAESCVDFKKDMDLLGWWKVRNKNFKCVTC